MLQHKFLLPFHPLLELLASAKNMLPVQRNMLTMAQRIARRPAVATLQSAVPQVQPQQASQRRSMSKSALEGELTEFSVVYTGLLATCAAHANL